MDRNETGDLPSRRINPIRRITSESADGNQRIVIDLIAETVTFVGCHKKAPLSFFTLYRPRQTEFVCPFTDILHVYEYDARARGAKGQRLGPPRMAAEVTTAAGTARFWQIWSNYDATRDVLRETSASTPDPPWQRNPKIVTRLQFLIAGVFTAIIIGLFLWLTGWP